MTIPEGADPRYAALERRVADLEAQVRLLAQMHKPHEPVNVPDPVWWRLPPPPTVLPPFVYGGVHDGPVTSISGQAA